MTKDSMLLVQGHRFNPWCRKIPRATEQISLYVTTTEPVLCNRRSRHSERPAAMETQGSQK